MEAGNCPNTANIQTAALSGIKAHIARFCIIPGTLNLKNNMEKGIKRSFVSSVKHILVRNARLTFSLESAHPSL